ncbi:MAG: DUF4174 domain-containing protein [Planctomycetota bacterium]|nr:DUF4174 domain-containing protein [Planctomycetota bacterium]
MTSLPGCSGPDESSTDQWFADQRWVHRMLVFTDVAPDAGRQRALLEDREEALLDRNLLVIELESEQTTLITGRAPGRPDAKAFRTRFDLPSDRFELVLVGKDGRVKRRRTEPMQPDELWSIIDAMPMRIDEMNRRTN